MKRLIKRSIAFDPEAEFLQASWRPTVQRDYELAQSANRISDEIIGIRRAIGESDRVNSARQHEATEHGRHNQEKMIATVYSVELLHVFSETLLGSATHGSIDDWLVYAGTAVATFCTTQSLLENRRHRGHGTSAWLIFAVLDLDSGSRRGLPPASALTARWNHH